MWNKNGYLIDNIKCIIYIRIEIIILSFHLTMKPQNNDFNS